MNDDPTTYDAPSRPRRYVLSGGDEPQASVALAVLGDMLDKAERVERDMAGSPATSIALQRAVVGTLRVARERVAAAEARR